MLEILFESNFRHLIFDSKASLLLLKNLQIKMFVFSWTQVYIIVDSNISESVKKKFIALFQSQRMTNVIVHIITNIVALHGLFSQ